MGMEYVWLSAKIVMCSLPPGASSQRQTMPHHEATRLGTSSLSPIPGKDSRGPIENLKQLPMLNLLSTYS